ncbi:MAG: C40 family peptidase [Clostridiales bacterium]|jgi:cell wall-associated NlpC family hydrolase|nr:C40 family peptidase [Clostridiales bacterium]
MKAVVANIMAPLSKEPFIGSELADEALFGYTLECLSPEKDGFVKVKTHYLYTGYAKSSDLAFPPSAEKWQRADKWTVWAPNLDIKKAPDVKAQTIAESPRGGLLEKIPGEGGFDGWIKVGLPSGACGYARSPFLRSQKASWSRDQEESIRKCLTDTAKMYLGTQYRWGGKTPSGIDCSGLTSISYLLNGIIIYRDAAIKDGFEMREISFEDKKPGDLLFFKAHVAMYLGESLFIHSTSYEGGEGVVINSLDPKSPIFRDLRVLKAGSVF